MTRAEQDFQSIMTHAATDIVKQLKRIADTLESRSDDFPDKI